MEAGLFYSSSEWVVLIATSAVLMLAAVIGFYVGRYAGRHGSEQSQIGIIQSAVLGMLALMLGFTFGVASTRYDTRRYLAIDEANAIGTTFLRAQTLPEPYRTNLSNMLHDYVDLRLKSASNVNDYNALRRIQQETINLQQAMWKQAALVTRKYQNDITGLFEESLNTSIDLYSSRVATFTTRVPSIILWILLIIALFAQGIVGYGFGLAEQRSWLIMALIAVIIAAVIVMIIDLDRSETGPTRVSHQSMLDLRKSLPGFEMKNR